MVEAERVIPSVQTLLRSISDRPSLRIAQKESLNQTVLLENLEPQQVKEIVIYSEELNSSYSVGVENVLSPYTETGAHVMLLDTTKTYRPTPSEIPLPEMEGMIQISRRILEYMDTMPLDITAWGFNNSPINSGVQEQKGGMQSLISKHHIHVWNRSRDMAQKPLAELPKTVQDYLEGDSFNILGDEVISQIMRNVTSPFFDTEKMWTERQVVHVPLTLSLRDFFRNPREAAEVIKRLHTEFEAATVEFWDAITEEPYRLFEGKLREVFEEGKVADENLLSTNPHLRDIKERKQNIESLPSSHFPPEVVKKLSRLNAFLCNRDEVEAESWVRNGLGYTFVIVQDKNEPTATLYIRPAILIRTSIGGIVETQGLSLQRILATDPGAQKKIDENIANMRNLKALLPNEIFT